MAWYSSNDNTLSRPLGDSECAFLRGTGPEGIGDMFLHLDFVVDGRAEEVMARERVVLSWAIVRVMHPLLMCEVDSQSEQFRFHIPPTVQSLLSSASSSLTYTTLPRLSLILTHLNSPRQHLSPSHLSHLTISKNLEDTNHLPLYHIFMVAPHFIGDGTALHQSTHDLLVLLSSSRSNDQLLKELEAAFESLRGSWSAHLPPSLEHGLPSPPSSPFALAASKVNFLQVAQREIGGHVLPRLSLPGTGGPPTRARAPTCTKFLEHVFSVEETAKVLKACKQKGVSVNHLMVAGCAVAWARVKAREQSDGEWKENSKHPLMIYTAINLRGHLPTSTSPSRPFPRTYWFLPLTYYTISLPAYLPSKVGPSSSFNPTTLAPVTTPLPHLIWSRARLAKQQTAKIVKSRWLVHRARIMASQRAGTKAGHSTSLNLQEGAQLPPHARASTFPASPGPAPSKALMGVSLIGNLDRTYLRHQYSSAPPSSLTTNNQDDTRRKTVGTVLRLKSVTTASKLKRGGILLLAHTFHEKLWLQVVWDAEGFEKGWMEGNGKSTEGFLREVVRVLECATGG